MGFQRIGWGDRLKGGIRLDSSLGTFDSPRKCSKRQLQLHPEGAISCRRLVEGISRLAGPAKVWQIVVQFGKNGPAKALADRVAIEKRIKAPAIWTKERKKERKWRERERKKRSEKTIDMQHTMPVDYIIFEFIPSSSSSSPSSSEEHIDATACWCWQFWLSIPITVGHKT